MGFQCYQNSPQYRKHNHRGVGNVPLEAPSLIAGKVFWLDATYGVFTTEVGTTLTTDGGNVGRWEDRAESGYHFYLNQGAGPAYPTYRTGTSGINGHPGIEFRTANNGQMLRNSIMSIPSGALTFMATVRPYVASGASAQCLFVSNQTASGVGFFHIANVDTAVGILDGATWRETAADVASGDAQIYCFRIQAGSGAIERNGTRIMTTGTQNARQIALSGSIGGDSDGVGLMFDGQIGEAILFQSWLSNADVNTLGAYLANKWSITYNAI